MSTEIAEMWHFAREHGFAEKLKKLHFPRFAPLLWAACGDWILIAAVTAATIMLGWPMAPLAILVIGNRQRALGNILHDASHQSFGAARKHIRVLTDILLCWPLWVSMKLYRRDHMHHHWYLADPQHDPDFIHDETRLSRHWLRMWLNQILSPRMFRISLFSHLPRMGPGTLLGVTCWWATVSGAITLISGLTSALVFLGLWIAARATAFHAITSFREISDHAGLCPGSIIGFSRNHPITGNLAHVIHPHNNGYHLLHHLAPGIPFYAVPQAHRLLLQWPAYAGAEQCHSYFSGTDSAVRSWLKERAF